MRIIILILSALLLLSLIGNEKSLSSVSNNIQATSPTRPWQDIDPKSLPKFRVREQHGPQSYRSLNLNVESFKTILRRAPLESVNTNQEPVTLALPLPGSDFMRFNIKDSPIMDPQLANRYPEIKTYSGQSIDDPTATTRFDWTQFGFHAIIFSSRGTVMIEPDSQEDVSNYIVYFQDQVSGSFQCDVDTATQEAALQEQARLKTLRGMRASVSSGTTLQTYRLAVGVTAEYTQAYGKGTVDGALAAITTTMNIVNGVYQRELAFRLVFIANEDSLIFTDTTTDGYSSGSISLLLSQNQNKLDTVIGTGNYDIGHVFDGNLSGGTFQGQAALGAVCRTSDKGRGASITEGVPPSSVYAAYLVAHEMGHQFGAAHTFNSISGGCG